LINQSDADQSNQKPAWEVAVQQKEGFKRRKMKAANLNHQNLTSPEIS
jgi:hypothetical protein